MMILPEDIKLKIRQFYKDPDDITEVEKLLLGLWSMPLNVGPEQLARSILIIAEGNLSEIKKIISSGFYGDPRDVIMNAENKIGNPKNYFIDPFE
jgi:hypothetical protein